MITIHHLGRSQSDRVVWLMEELQLPYKLKWYDRNEKDQAAPAEYKALHPAATAPVITDVDTVLTESAVVLEHICHRHADAKLVVGPDKENYEEYLYWMHFNNNVQGLFFAKMTAVGSEQGLASKIFSRRENIYFNYLNERLSKSDYLAGPDFTCADIMVTFNLTALPLFGGRAIDDLEHVRAYVQRITARPAYVKAMSIAGPGATPP